MPEKMTPLTVVLATDSFPIGDGLACLVSSVPDMSVVGRARSHDEMLTMIETLNPDVAVSSIRTPFGSALTTLRNDCAPGHARMPDSPHNPVMRRVMRSRSSVGMSGLVAAMIFAS